MGKKSKGDLRRWVEYGRIGAPVQGALMAFRADASQQLTPAPAARRCGGRSVDLRGPVSFTGTVFAEGMRPTPIATTSPAPLSMNLGL